MFRIKTDIRQFNCETREKVEKLIRSWVIRPTDLMLDEARQTWSPIGQREEFASIFEDIKDLSDVEDMSAEEANTPESQGGADDMLQQDLDEMEQELAQLEQEVSDAPGAQTPGQAGILKLRALKQDDEDASDSVVSEPLPMPVAPAGVEGVAAADEPTIMTERTADLLGVIDEEIAEQAAAAASEPLPLPVAPAGVEGVAETDEATQVFAREDEEEQEEAPLTASVTEDEEEDASLEEPSPVEEESASEDVEVEDLEEQEAPRLGRHDLPEELFLTNELTRSELVSPLEPLRDDLRNAEGPPEEDEETEAWEVTQQIESPLEKEAQASSEELPLPTEGLDGVSLALSEAAESDIHSEWESMMQLDELRETDEFNIDEHLGLNVSSDIEPDDEASGFSNAAIEDTLDLSHGQIIGLEDTAEFKADEIFTSPTAAPPSLEEGSDTTSTNTLEQEPSEATFELEEIEKEAPSPALDESSAPAEGVEHAEPDDSGDEHEEESHEESVEERTFQSTEPLFQEASDFVSEGYAMALPFEIGPSQEDLRQGVLRSTASEEEKDHAFPRPQPKKLKQLVKRRYGYGDPPSERVIMARQATQRAVPMSATASKASTAAPRSSAEPPRDYSRIVAIFVLILIVLVIATLIIISK